MGLLRKAVVVGVLLYAVPLPPESDDVAGGEASPIATLQAAGQTISDARGFCSRQPTACTVGNAMVARLQSRAKYVMKLAANWTGNGAAKNDLATAALRGPGQDAPPLRLSTLTDAPKAKKINDLLKGSAN